MELEELILKNITADSFDERETFTLIKDAVDFYVRFNRIGEAKEIRLLLLPLYKQARTKLNKQQQDAYDNIFVKLELFTILTLHDEDIKDILQNHIMRSFALGISLIGQFREYIDFYHDYDNDFQDAQKFKMFMLGNRETIGNASLVQLFNEYQILTGQKLPRGGLQRMNFINQNEAAKQLSKEEKSMVVRILELFDWFSYPTPSEEYIEGAPGMVKTINATLQKKEDVFDIKFIEILQKVFPKELHAVNEEMWRKVYNFLIEKKIKNVDALQSIPLSANGLQVFLRAWFADFEHITDDLSLKIVVKIVNGLKKNGYEQYMEIVYFDQTDGKFHWKEY